MTEAEAAMEDDALVWVVRTRDPDFTDWAGFTAWLEGDSMRTEIYDRLSAADDALPALVPARPVLPEPANDRGPARWRWIGGGAIAAALVAVLSVGALRTTADPYTITTAPGERSIVKQKDGTLIALNGGTTLRLDRSNPRFAALDRGEAMFTVTHDTSDPFRVTVGDAVFEDAGTMFNISRTAHTTRIGVAEGKVIYNPGREAIALPAGRALRADDGAAQVVLGPIAPQAVAGWQRGQMVYDAAPLSDIAEDLARTIGVPLRVAPGATALRFTGTLAVDRNPERFFARAAPLLGVRAERQGKGWLLKAGDGTGD